MATTTSVPLASGTLIGERFVIQRPLGQGGMASVYEARDLRLRQSVAVKVLSSAFASDAGAVERFLREARAVVRLRNQHVVRVLDAGTLPHGAPYLVMEYLDGESMGARLARLGPLSPSEVVDYMLQALEALAEAHRAGIVHRDLKPDNLMLVQSEDGLPQIKVIDFGISKLLGPDFTLKHLTLQSSFLGSPLYASPEQLSDAARVDARTDLWSLGVVMYELLSAQLPFDARSPSALMMAICSAEPRRLDRLRPDVPSELAEVVARCLRKNAEQRFASARELACALAPFASGSLGRMSVNRIVRVQSSAPASRGSDAAATLLSLPPTWSSATVTASEIPTPPKRRARRLAIALGGALVGAGLFALWVYARSPAIATSRSLQRAPVSAATLGSPLAFPTSLAPVGSAPRATLLDVGSAPPPTSLAPDGSAQVTSALPPDARSPRPHPPSQSQISASPHRRLSERPVAVPIAVPVPSAVGAAPSGEGEPVPRAARPSAPASSMRPAAPSPLPSASPSPRPSAPASSMRPAAPSPLPSASSSPLRPAAPSPLRPARSLDTENPFAR